MVTIANDMLEDSYLQYHRPIDSPVRLGSAASFFEVDTGRLREVKLLEQERAA
jgi:hypothetical protein